MWIDTHCHLDAAEFGGQQSAFAQAAAQQQVSWIVIPAVERANFQAVATIAAAQSNCAYALGIHPIYVPHADEADLLTLRAAIATAMADPLFVAIGEIGLDFFVPDLNTGVLREKQEYFYVEQLKLAREFDLPVLLHVRKSQDTLLKYLRRIKVQGGIAHAFNGSFQQAQAFIDLGFKLGFGGAMTFTRALQIRRLAEQLPLDTLVLETDAPDMSPVWLHPEKNAPQECPRIGGVLAQLRNMPIHDLAQATSANARIALPRLALLG
ncbi:TatD family hydrolase [Glaciimonas soli]|uniref:TatD family deoxyribonuclease n=1 Tax=Glaciimonas soli TaxID=2590999 RepID=A0A843YQR0_9BURK|nr:TatD family hydrolase [Glaciimonas soli]MQQ99827.1 TatD family deoxyribonuclease [Glaciimonas soli]